MIVLQLCVYSVLKCLASICLLQVDVAGYYRLPIATSKIAICILQDFTLLQVPGRHPMIAWKEFFFKKPNQTNLFLVSSSFSVQLYFV